MARPRQKISVYTLSKELGLSAATVSKALGEYPQVGEKTRARVRAAAKKLNFKPAQISRRRLNVCALIQRDPGAPINFKPYVSSVLEGLARYAWSHDLESSLFGGDYEELNQMDLVRELYKRQVDGVVIVNADANSQFIESLVEQQFPHVLLMTSDEKSGRRVVAVDEHQVAQNAAEFLTQLGHRKILVLVSNAEGRSGRDRLAGFMDAMNNADIPVDKSLIITPKDLTQGGLASGFSLVSGAMRNHPEVTAIYAMDQNMALGASRALWSMGYRIPQDVSLICCDDCEYHEYATPSISAVSIPAEKLAFYAAQLVHQAILGETDGHDIQGDMWLQPKLIVRESTGPVRKDAMVDLSSKSINRRNSRGSGRK
jgi:DNA-binding LacI/PurR family transcriptional regulator